MKYFSIDFLFGPFHFSRLMLTVGAAALIADFQPVLPVPVLHSGRVDAARVFRIFEQDHRSDGHRCGSQRVGDTKGASAPICSQ